MFEARSEGLYDYIVSRDDNHTGDGVWDIDVILMRLLTPSNHFHRLCRLSIQII